MADVLLSLCVDAACGWACKTTAAKAASLNGVTGDHAEKAKKLLTESPIQCSVEPSPKQQQMVERESKATLAKTDNIDKCPKMHWDAKETITVTPAAGASAAWIEQRTGKGTTLFGFKDYKTDAPAEEADGMVNVSMDDGAAFTAPHVMPMVCCIYHQNYSVAAYARYDDDKLTYVSYMRYGSDAWAAPCFSRKGGEATSS